MKKRDNMFPKSIFLPDSQSQGFDWKESLLALLANRYTMVTIAKGQNWWLSL
jgi:hypothetical protein